MAWPKLYFGSVFTKVSASGSLFSQGASLALNMQLALSNVYVPPLRVWGLSAPKTRTLEEGLELRVWGLGCRVYGTLNPVLLG